MFLSCTVPAPVPSVTQGSWLPAESAAEKISLLLTTMALVRSMLESLAPAAISLTSTVPALRPSVFHSSEPLAAVVALK